MGGAAEGSPGASIDPGGGILAPPIHWEGTT